MRPTTVAPRHQQGYTPCKGLTDYWDIYPYLPKETRGYVPAFIAANYIMNYYCDHNICPMVAELPAKSDTIMVNRDIHFEQIAKVLNIDIETLKDLNPQYRRNIVNGSSKPSSLRLPAMAIASFIDQQDSIYSCTVDNFQNKRTEVDITEPQKEYSSSKYSSHSRKSANVHQDIEKTWKVGNHTSRRHLVRHCTS